MKTDLDIIDDIIRAMPEAKTPEPLRQRLLAVHEEHKQRIAMVRLILLATAAESIDQWREVCDDHESIDRIMQRELEICAAVVIRAMKHRQGLELESARNAIIAYSVADEVLAANAAPADMLQLARGWYAAMVAAEDEAAKEIGNG